MTAALLVAGLASLAIGALLVPSVRQAIMACLTPAWRIKLSGLRHGVSVDTAVDMTMPDGVRLRASLYLPRGANERLATVLVRLPYRRLLYDEGQRLGMHFSRHGYAVLVQDLRGTGDSGGELLPWRDAATDGIATLDWIVRQPWSNGKVGTVGCSALGEVQFVLAKERHPALRAMIPSGAGGAVGSAAGRHGYFGLYEGGVFQLASGFGWFVNHGAKDPRAEPARPFDLALHLRRLPVSGLVREVRPAPNGYVDHLATPMGASRWADWGFLTDGDRATAPALVINTWGDQTVGETLALAEHWRKADPAQASRHKVVIAPGKHCGHGEVEAPTRFGELSIERASRPYLEWYLRWFDRWLRDRGDGLPELAAYNYFMIGEDRWLSSDTWPPAQSHAQRWYLASAGNANSRKGDGRLVLEPGTAALSDSFRYDPMDPVPSRGGPICCTGESDERAGPADQADVEARKDVLVYTSDPLARDLRIAGPLKARLTVSSTAPDTDLVARLAHVWPDGRSTGIQEGALRLRYRDGFDSPSLLAPDRRYDVVVDMRSIAYRVPKGHRLRLHVTSSSFPRLERNLNTGAPVNADETRSAVALNRVFHGPDSASWVELPVLDEAP